MATNSRAERKSGKSFHRTFNDCWNFCNLLLARRKPAEASSAVESRDGMKPEVQDSEVQNGKSLLEGNGFKVIKKIGSGSYSKVKVNSIATFPIIPLKLARIFRTWRFSSRFPSSRKKWSPLKSCQSITFPTSSSANSSTTKSEWWSSCAIPTSSITTRASSRVTGSRRILHHQTLTTLVQRLYVIMQFAENGSILDLIHKEKRLPEARACHFFRQIVAAVEYCHSQGICHRDIKCENILLDSNMNVKLIDFGFARSFKKSSKAVTAIGSVAPPQQSSTLSNSERQPRVSETYCGSYAYASPEILKGTPYDPFQSDVWAMGCVLYAMVFGRLPFDDRDPHKLLKVKFPSTFSKLLIQLQLHSKFNRPSTFPSPSTHPKALKRASRRSSLRSIAATRSKRLKKIPGSKSPTWINRNPCRREKCPKIEIDREIKKLRRLKKFFFLFIGSWDAHTIPFTPLSMPDNKFIAQRMKLSESRRWDDKVLLIKVPQALKALALASFVQDGSLMRRRNYLMVRKWMRKRNT